MRESIKSIIEWSEQAFPDATIEGQIEKYHQEQTESYDCLRGSKEELFELADCFIVACSIGRFDLEHAAYYFGDVEQMIIESEFTRQEVCAAVDAKMAINRLRSWEKKNGNYQHVEE